MRNEAVIQKDMAQNLIDHANLNMLWYWTSHRHVKKWLEDIGHTITTETSWITQKKWVPPTEETSTEAPPASTAIPEPVKPERIPPDSDSAPYALAIVITFVIGSALSVVFLYRVFANTAGTEEEEAEARRQLSYNSDRFARKTILTA